MARCRRLFHLWESSLIISCYFMVATSSCSALYHTSQHRDGLLLVLTIGAAAITDSDAIQTQEPMEDEYWQEAFPKLEKSDQDFASTESSLLIAAHKTIQNNVEHFNPLRFSQDKLLSRCFQNLGAGNIMDIIRTKKDMKDLSLPVITERKKRLLKQCANTQTEDYLGYKNVVTEVTNPYQNGNDFRSSRRNDSNTNEQEILTFLSISIGRNKIYRVNGTLVSFSYQREHSKGGKTEQLPSHNTKLQEEVNLQQGNLQRRKRTVSSLQPVTEEASPTSQERRNLLHSQDSEVEDTASEEMSEDDDESSEERERERLAALLQQDHVDCVRSALTDPEQEEGCGRAWDSVLCWPPSPPATTTSLPCPSHVPGLAHPQGAATRWCDAEGTWASRPIVAVPSTTPPPSDVMGRQPFRRRRRASAFVSFYHGWSNYTTCLASYQPPTHTVPPLIEAWLPAIRQTALVGYSISLSSLLLSCAILSAFKKLRCPRNMVHLHLFASFMLRAVAVLLRSSLPLSSMIVISPLGDHDGPVADGGWGCRTLVVLWHYFIIANYSWILMEGLYLHNLIFRALFTDSSAITPYVLLGWGLPLLVVVSWAVARVLLDDTHCWLLHGQSWLYWVFLRTPVAASIFLNFLFFINIVRVLTLKMKSSFGHEFKFGQLGRSTLVLIPLFGVHSCLLWGLSVAPSPRLELAWLILDQVFSSFQGLVVGILYCLMNGEVRQELRKLYTRVRGDDDNNYTSYSTVSNTRFSLPRMSLGGVSMRRSSAHVTSVRRCSALGRMAPVCQETTQIPIPESSEHELHEYNGTTCIGPLHQAVPITQTPDSQETNLIVPTDFAGHPVPVVVSCAPSDQHSEATVISDLGTDQSEIVPTLLETFSMAPSLISNTSLSLETCTSDARPEEIKPLIQTHVNTSQQSEILSDLSVHCEVGLDTTIPEVNQNERVMLFPEIVDDHSFIATSNDANSMLPVPATCNDGTYITVEPFSVPSPSSSSP